MLLLQKWPLMRHPHESNNTTHDTTVAILSVSLPFTVYRLLPLTVSYRLPLVTVYRLLPFTVAYRLQFAAFAGTSSEGGSRMALHLRLLSQPGRDGSGRAIAKATDCKR